MPRDDDLLTTAEVADLAGVSRTTVWRWAEDGILPTAVELPSGHRRFRRSDVDALLAPSPKKAS
ncbi:MAG TPA: helix-turn-helix domain-containing protein [Acidimicrobiales bacterium]|nr:helix-turn-helix domain-containing protein [Acidimicrobiales bacterium]